MKKITVAVLTLSLLVLLSTAALAYTNLGQIVSNLTGKTEAEISALRGQGQTYGQIAQDAGKLEQFKQEMQQFKKETIDQRVASGQLTQEKADALKKAIDERIASCTGEPGTRQERMGLMFGGGKGNSQGRGGMGRGMGQGQGSGMGQGFGYNAQAN